MSASPYAGKKESDWTSITSSLIAAFPIPTSTMVEAVLESWKGIFNSTIGPLRMGIDIVPSPQITAFFLHELIGHHLSMHSSGNFRTGASKNEKDIHCNIDEALSIEIKASSHASQVFGNRSYAQPKAGASSKSKDGYFLLVNFNLKKGGESATNQVRLIRFGYLEHSDWIAQKSQTGQQARLSAAAYSGKLAVIYRAP